MARDRRGAAIASVREPVCDDAHAQAFAMLYHHYLDPIYRYCYRRLPTAEDAEDATSLIFARALAALPRQREEHALRSWLFAIAHNVVADHYRAQRPTLTLTAAAEVTDPARAETRSLEDDELRSLLARLPDDQARILELRLAGLTGPEIARVLGKSATAVKVAQFRAYARLRLLLGQTRAEAETEVQDADR
jgi:RNA polymerase sigma-70 factor, ECF subfamily